MIKNKEKLNGFEINNFFIDGYTFHNNFKESSNHRVKTKASKENEKTPYTKLRRELHHFDDALKN